MAMMEVDVLWEYREFKRDEVPAPRSSFIETHSLEEVTNHVKEAGMLPVELSIVKDQALLTDGNHRIAAARHLGWTHVPVYVTVHFGEGVEEFYDHTLARFRKIDQHLEAALKEIFL
jgi:hypothetical protein